MLLVRWKDAQMKQIVTCQCQAPGIPLRNMQDTSGSAGRRDTRDLPEDGIAASHQLKLTTSADARAGLNPHQNCVPNAQWEIHAWLLNTF